MEKELKMKFSVNTIKHLGIQMYSTLPPVLSELISNAYDADAEFVTVEFFDGISGQKKIIVTDNGNGMDFDELNNKFLFIGRNRRVSDGEDVSPKFKRKVTGKKGLGKLAMFGIAGKISIETVKNGLLNEFYMKYEDMLAVKEGEEYKPSVSKQNVPTGRFNGTIITLEEIIRKTPFNIATTALSISKRFVINSQDFKIILKQKDTEIQIDEHFKYKNINFEFSWEFPTSDDEYAKTNKITGFIKTADKPLENDYKGITLYARGKLVNKNEFYGVKQTNHAYEYMTGEFHVDFIDDDLQHDFVTTNRDGLVWDRDELSELQGWLFDKIRQVANEWKQKRRDKRNDELKKNSGHDYQEWLDTLGAHDKKIAKKIVDIVLDSDAIDTDKAVSLIEYVQSSFEFESFKNFADDLESAGLDETKLLALLKEWQMIEAKEFYRLSMGRIKAIDKLDEYMRNNAKEVPTLHNFIKSFPWLLDPRMMEFKDEVTYSNLLKEKYKDDSEPDEDKRIDFLCSLFGDTILVVELKRPQAAISKKQLEQLTEYCVFIKKHLGNSDASIKNVSGYILGGRLVNTDMVEMQVSMMASQRMYFRPYSELLSQARNYHSEFLEKYKKLKKIK